MIKQSTTSSEKFSSSQKLPFCGAFLRQNDETEVLKSNLQKSQMTVVEGVLDSGPQDFPEVDKSKGVFLQGPSRQADLLTSFTCPNVKR